jgi:hypothetical protein
MLYKNCTICSNFKPVNEFHKASSSKDGYSSHCAKCKRGTNATLRKQPAYNSFQAAKQRCERPTYENYSRYGGRGIEFHLGNTYKEFWELMGVEYNRCLKQYGPNVKLTIERIDNDGHYEVDNCTFIPHADQASNRCSNVTLTYKGQTHTLAQWSRLTSIHHRTIEARVQRGWLVADILSTEPLSPGEKLYL